LSARSSDRRRARRAAAATILLFAAGGGATAASLPVDGFAHGCVLAEGASAHGRTVLLRLRVLTHPGTCGCRSRWIAWRLDGPAGTLAEGRALLDPAPGERTLSLRRLRAGLSSARPRAVDERRAGGDEPFRPRP